MDNLQEIQLIPLDDVFVDYGWNGRSLYNVMSQDSDAVQDTTAGGPAQGAGLAGLERTLELRGQDTPCVVRQVVSGVSLGGIRTTLPLELICGFRRITAIRRLHERGVVIPGLPKGAFLGVVRRLPPLEACLLNGRENTDRKNLDTPDTIRLVVRLSTMGLSSEQIAHELSVTHGYIRQLLRAGRLPFQILAHWRGDMQLTDVSPIARRQTLGELLEIERQMVVQHLSPEQTIELYIQRLVPYVPKPRLPSNHIEARVQQIATLCGQLVRLGILSEGNLEWSRAIGPKADGYPIDCGKTTVEERARYWAIADTFFKGALKP